MYIPCNWPDVLDDYSEVPGPLVVQPEVLREGLGTEQLEPALNKVSK